MRLERNTVNNHIMINGSATLLNTFYSPACSTNLFIVFLVTCSCCKQYYYSNMPSLISVAYPKAER